jgi:hypothetical protein
MARDGDVHRDRAGAAFEAREVGQLDQHKRLHVYDQRVVGASRLPSLDHDGGAHQSVAELEGPGGHGHGDEEVTQVADAGQWKRRLAGRVGLRDPDRTLDDRPPLRA